LSADEEWARLSPVLLAALTLGLPVSVDTCKTEVMQRALDAGADIINDIRALSAPGALETVAAHASCGVCLMHMRGDPASMQAQAHYTDVVDEVKAFLAARVGTLQAAGIALDRITLDPGVGFGKTPEHNLTLLACLPGLGLAAAVGLVAQVNPGASHRPACGAAFGCELGRCAGCRGQRRSHPAGARRGRNR